MSTAPARNPYFLSFFKFFSCKVHSFVSFYRYHICREDQNHEEKSIDYTACRPDSGQFSIIKRLRDRSAERRRAFRRGRDHTFHRRYHRDAQRLVQCGRQRPVLGCHHHPGQTGRGFHRHHRRGGLLPGGDRPEGGHVPDLRHPGGGSGSPCPRTRPWWPR